MVQREDLIRKINIYVNIINQGLKQRQLKSSYD